MPSSSLCRKPLSTMCFDLMEKEETVLYPTSLAMISPAEFEEMKSGDREIGFAFISLEPEEKTEEAPSTENSTAPQAGFGAELASLLNKYGYSAGGNASADTILDVATGKLTLEQINLIYKHMPVDISYVDETKSLSSIQIQSTEYFLAVRM